MIAPQNQTMTVIDSMDGTLQEWYNAIDGALRASEVRPGEYEYSIEVSHSGQCPVYSGGSTMVDVKCERLKCVSYDNSYLEIKQTFDVYINKAQNANLPSNGKRLYYIGYPTAFGLIDQYRVYSEGDLIQTVNYPHYEDFLLNNLAIGDYAKESNDCYATFDKVQKMDPNVPGVYVDLASIATTDKHIPIELHFRIPLNMFLIYKNIKWYPGFWGKTTFEIFPSHTNLVWCPIFPEGYSPVNLTGEAALTGFVQINTTANNLCDYTSPDYTAVSAQKFSVTSSILTMCKIRMANYTLKMDVYNALQAKYLQVSLLFPIQEVKTVKFSQTIGTNTTDNLTCSLPLHHCDSMFIVFNKDPNDRNCFNNPEFTHFQININGKLYPRETYASVDDPKFTNLILDALNINNNTLISIPKDLSTSLQPYRRIRVYGATGALSTNDATYLPYDRSKFLIGVAFCNDEDFQGGLSPDGTVQIQFSYTRSSGTVDYAYAPTAIFLEDKIMKMFSMKPTGSPQISTTYATVEQIQLGAL